GRTRARGSLLHDARSWELAGGAGPVPTAGLRVGGPIATGLRSLPRRDATRRRRRPPGFRRRCLRSPAPGLTCVLLHPAIDTPEIRSITGDWRGRVADFEVFRQPSLREHIRDLGIHQISYRPLRDAAAGAGRPDLGPKQA